MFFWPARLNASTLFFGVRMDEIQVIGMPTGNKIAKNRNEKKNYRELNKELDEKLERRHWTSTDVFMIEQRPWSLSE